MLILGVDLANHLAAEIALRLDSRDSALAERIGLAIDSNRADLPIGPDEARALLAVLGDTAEELPLRTALEAELARQANEPPSRGFGRWGRRRTTPAE